MFRYIKNNFIVIIHSIGDYFLFLKDKQIKTYSGPLISSILIVFMLLYVTFFVQLELYFSLSYLFDIFMKKESIIPITVLFGVIMLEIFILIFFDLINNFIKFYILGTGLIIIANLSSIENDLYYLNSESMIAVTLCFAILCKTIAIKNVKHQIQPLKLYEGTK